MATVKDVYDALDGLAAFETQMGFDNAGFLVGRVEKEVRTILVALDITKGVVEEAVRLGAELIVSHHPVIFHPVKSITDEDVTGQILLELTEHQIAAICSHTNLDAAEGGVNDCLAKALALTNIVIPHPGKNGETEDFIRRAGKAHQLGMSAQSYAAYVKERLHAANVRFVDGGRPVEWVQVGGGSCGSMLREAMESGADTFVTADVKYDVFLEAKALGMNLLDAGHFATEQVVCPVLVEFLPNNFPALDVKLSQTHREVYESV